MSEPATSQGDRGAARLRSTYPQAQRQFPIVASRSRPSHRRRTFLCGLSRVRLDLRFDEKIWSGNIRFLTVRS